MPIYSPLDRFSPRRLISNLQYSQKHRTKPSGQEFYSLMYGRHQPLGRAQRLPQAGPGNMTFCFLRATGQQNSCFRTEGREFQVLIFPVSLPASTGRAETLQVLQREAAKHFKETLEEDAFTWSAALVRGSLYLFWFQIYLSAGLNENTWRPKNLIFKKVKT